jgi:hypothetical protein
MKLPTPKQIVEFFFFQPIAVAKTLKFAVEKELVGAEIIFTTLFKFINHSLAEPASDPTIKYCAESMAGITTTITIGLCAVGASLDLRHSAELLGLESVVNWLYPS